MRVFSIMTADPVSVTADCAMDEALQALDDRAIRHLPVVDDGELAGLISDRDVLEAIGWLPSRVHACKGPGGSDDLPKTVREIMSGPVVQVGPEDSLTLAAVEMLHRQIGCLPVVEDRALIGILTELDLLGAYVAGRLDGQSVGASRLAGEHMTSRPLAVNPHKSLGHATGICQANGFRHLPVVDEGHLVGIVSDRDLRRAAGVGRQPTMPIGDIMTHKPTVVSPEATLRQCAKLMCEQKISALPVVNDDECVGIVTLSDVLDRCLDASRPE